MKLQIKFTFDNKNWIFGDENIINAESTENINKVLWILLHTLKVKQVHFIMKDDVEIEK